MVTITAEIHTPSNSSVPMAPSIFENIKKKDNKKNESEDADEIVMVESETVILSPNNNIVSPTLSNKKKWSLKIQLQSCHVNSLGKMSNNLFSY